MHENNLNIRQKDAVETLEGPLLIIAGAGAGKTKTITHRILNLIKHGVQPSKILAITFTNKAAKEMRERVFHLIESDKTLNIPISFAERPFVSTFHALGVHIIKENSALLGITRHFTIYDRGDSKRAIKDALEELSLDPKQYEPGTILNVISREKGDGITLSTYKNNQKEYFQKIVAQVWEKYEATLAKEKSLDFDDLLLKTAMILKMHPEVKKRYASIWNYIHIDEYQDTNRVQYEIASLLAESHRNICVVGDVDQNIYSWRGADIENLLNFEKEYPEAKVITLEENYRSTQTILAAANNVIKKNTMRREKNLFTKNIEGEKIELLISYTEHEEARMIADEARKLISDGTNAREIAVLYRANFQSRVLEEAFLNKNIPYQVLGVKFFERKEVKDVLSFIKASLNRESTNDMVRIVNVPPRGIGKATMLKVIAGQEKTLGPSLRNKVEQFLHLLEKIKAVALKETPSTLIKYIIKETGMETVYKNGGLEEQEKLENLRELVSVASQYDALPTGEAIEKLLENAALATDQDELEKDHDAVKLMTVHASKGLEFDYVFIAGLEEDLFPHQRMNEKEVSESQSEEERRLFYVAITRARKKVFLSYAQLRTIYGAQKVNTPSNFISDIGDEHIESKGDEEAPRGVKAIFIDF
ncbi:MAG: ATP-dependent helicase UvrD/PcrA [Patescibacteria group bacterium]|nr:ATP-dependent helicase UvrD/PcrA [Patescibacteria group bacterium]